MRVERIDPLQLAGRVKGQRVTWQEIRGCLHDFKFKLRPGVTMLPGGGPDSAFDWSGPGPAEGGPHSGGWPGDASLSRTATVDRARGVQVDDCRLRTFNMTRICISHCRLP